MSENNEEIKMILENRHYMPQVDRDREEEKENDEINEGGESDLRI